MKATITLLHEELALGAPLPLLPLGHLKQHGVLDAPVPLPELPVLGAGSAGVPRRHVAPRTEEPPAARALRLGDVVAAVVVRQHHRRAILEGAVGPLGPQQHGLAQRGAPPLEDLAGQDALAELRVQHAAAPLLGAPDVGDPVLDLGAHVAREAAAAEGVCAAPAGAVRVGGRHHVHADLAEHERRGDGDGRPGRRRRRRGVGALTFAVTRRGGGGGVVASGSCAAARWSDPGARRGRDGGGHHHLL